MSADWEVSAADAKLVLIGSNGERIDEDSFDNYDTIIIVDDWSDSSSRSVAIETPAQGRWTLEVVSSGYLGAVDFSATKGSDRPILAFQSSDNDTDKRQISFSLQVSGVALGTLVNLYYDMDEDGKNGVFLSSVTINEDGLASYLWDYSYLSSGDYYIYATVQSNNSSIVFASSETPLNIEGEADLSVDIVEGWSTEANEKIFSLVVKNEGDRTSSDSVLTLTPPSGVTLTEESGKLSVDENGVYSLHISALDAGEALTLRFSAQVGDDQSGQIVALISTDGYDKDAANDEVQFNLADEATRAKEGPKNFTELADYVRGDYGGDQQAQGGDDYVLDGLGNNKLDGGSGNDKLISLSGLGELRGGSGSDYLIGGFQSDRLEGNEGDDILQGDLRGSFLSSSDRIDGGAGDDVLMGGGGSDTFVFRPNEGYDRIGSFDYNDVSYQGAQGYSVNPLGQDFEIGTDRIELSGFSEITADNLLDYFTDTEAGAVFEAEDTKFLLVGIKTDDLSASNFLFV